MVRKTEHSAHVAGQMGTLDSRKPHSVKNSREMSWEDSTQITPRCLGLQVSRSLWKHVGVLGRVVKIHREGLFLDECIWSETACSQSLQRAWGCSALLDMNMDTVPSWFLSDILVTPGC